MSKMAAGLEYKIKNSGKNGQKSRDQQEKNGHPSDKGASSAKAKKSSPAAPGKTRELSPVPCPAPALSADAALPIEVAQVVSASSPGGSAAEYTVAKDGDPIVVQVKIAEKQDGTRYWAGIDCDRFRNFEKLLYDQRHGMVDELEKITGSIYHHYDNIATADEKYVRERFATDLNKFWENCDFYCEGIYFAVQIKKLTTQKEGNGTPKESVPDSPEEKPAKIKPAPGVMLKDVVEEVASLPSAGNPNDPLFSLIRLCLFPGERSTLEAVAKQNHTILSVSVSVSGTSAWKWDIKRCSGSPKLPLNQPAISLSDYQRLKGNPKIEICLKLSADGKEREKTYTLSERGAFSYEINDKYFVNENNRRVLLMDMGSTFTKYILMPIKKDREVRQEDFTEECKNYLSTKKFIDEFGIDTLGVSLEKFKPTMRDDPEKYSRFLIDAIHKIADKLSGNKIILDSIQWSFPDTDKTDVDFFGFVNRNVENQLADCVFSAKSSFSLSPEHEALHLMFAGLLERIGELTKGILDEAEKKKADIREKGRRNKAKHEIPQSKGFFGSLKDWWTDRDKKNQEMRRRIDEDTNREIQIRNEEIKIKWAEIELGIKFLNVVNSRSFLLLDAGGYSLDSYCELNGKKAVELCQSFECGGEHLKSEWARRERGHIDLDTIEGWLITQVPSRQKGVFQELTLKEYEKPLKIIQAKNGKIALLIISGGAARNENFHPMFADLALPQYVIEQCQEFAGWSYNSISSKLPILSSRELVDFINSFEYATGEDLGEWGNFFRRIVTDKSGNVESSFDIVGGMLQKITNFYGCDRLED